MSTKQVKSVVRVLDILKLFHEEQKPMRSVDIATKLNLPAASTHEILKTMVDMGYFSHGVPKGMYKPASRFPEIVEWVRDTVCDDSQLSGLMDALSEATHENVILAGQSNPHAKIYGSIPSLHKLGVNSSRGALLSPTQSLVGIASLAHFDADALDDFFEKLRISDPLSYKATDFGVVKSVLSDIQATGFALRYDLEVEGIGAICCPILSPSSVHGLVIGIVGPNHRMKEAAPQYVTALQRLSRKFGVKTRHSIHVDEPQLTVA